MRALMVKEFAPYETHARTDVPDPDHGPGEVAIATCAMGLNFPDILMVEGRYQHKPPRPFIPGFDAAGVVAAVGPGVTRTGPGDRVLTTRSHGAFTTRVVAPEAAVWRIPDEMSFEDASAFGLVYLTAYISMTENAKAQPGETVLVTGASGGVGLAMIQYGAALGMRMLGGVTSAEKAAIVIQNGAAATVDLAAENLREALRDQVAEFTEGKGVDLVMDMVGGDVFDAALRAPRPGGRIAIVGFAGGRIPEIKANYLLVKRLTAIGSPLTSGREDSDALKDKAMTAMLGLYAEGKLKPVISERLPFEDWQTGFRRFKERKVTGKIILVP